MKKHRIWYGILCLFAWITYFMANDKAALIFFAVVLITPAVSFLAQKFASSASNVKIQLKTSCYVDQKIQIKIKLQKASRLLSGPLYINFHFHNTLYDDHSDKLVVLQLSENQEMEFEYPVTMKDCGNIKISVTSAKYLDLLGLFSFHADVDLENEILVYPAQLQLNTFLQRKPITQNDGELYDDAKQGQDVNEVSGLREYIEGDSPKSIHWKLSSKIDKLVVREFGYPSNYDTLILYQLSKEAGNIEIPNKLNNVILSLCTSLSYSILEKNLEHEVGHIIGGNFKSTPVSSLSTYEQMVLNLLYKPIEKKESSNDIVYHFLRGNLKTNYTKVIFITPEYDEAAIRQFARSIDLTIVQVVDGKTPEYITANGYSVTSINADEYKQKTHNIAI